MNAPSYRPGGVTLRDGSFLALDIHDFSPPWRAGATPVVLVHGFSKHRRFWHQWLGPLSRDHKLICVDQRGHGESSPVPPGFRMNLDIFAEDMVDLLDALSIEKAHFVMAEFTSSVALLLAGRHPERVASLVLPGFGYNWRAGAVKPAEWADLIQREGTAAWARETVSARLPADAPAELREWYVGEQSRMPPEFMMSLFRYSADLDLSEWLPQVQAPALMLGGTLAKQDTADSLRVAKQRLPRGELVLFEGMPFNVMTACPDLCVDATLSFLSRVA
jgi:pimeloyl-ACP methyl ester carboxylesterase